MPRQHQPRKDIVTGKWYVCRLSFLGPGSKDKRLPELYETHREALLAAKTLEQRATQA